MIVGHWRRLSAVSIACAFVAATSIVVVVVIVVGIVVSTASCRAHRIGFYECRIVGRARANKTRRHDSRCRRRWPRGARSSCHDTTRFITARRHWSSSLSWSSSTRVTWSSPDKTRRGEASCHGRGLILGVGRLFRASRVVVGHAVVDDDDIVKRRDGGWSAGVKSSRIESVMRLDDDDDKTR